MLISNAIAATLESRIQKIQDNHWCGRTTKSYKNSSHA